MLPAGGFVGLNTVQSYHLHQGLLTRVKIYKLKIMIGVLLFLMNAHVREARRENEDNMNSFMQRFPVLNQL